MTSPAQGQPARQPAPHPQAASAQATAPQTQASPGTAQPAQASAPQTQATAQQAPARAPSTQPAGSSTPRLLRFARGAAAAAALLTGVVATGTFGTGGVNATPNVIAQQWVAAEEAGVEIAHADLLAAQRVSADDDALRSTYDQTVGTVAEDLTSMAGSGGAATTASAAAGPWTSFVVGTERAVADGSTEVYADASASARQAVTAARDLADQHAEDLRTGSRSTLTAVVGGAATLLMLGILVWLALRTRRILNVPLTVATLITAGLTYISLNPSALPVDYDQRVATASGTAQALQDVYAARQAQHATSLGLEDRWQDASEAARVSVQSLGSSGLNDQWSDVQSAGDQAAAGELGVQEAISGSQEAFDGLEAALREELTGQLDESSGAVGTPAAITSGFALLLGLIAAALAWAGISQRLKDYR